jgi:purine-binding chemotaxis protein CheW
MRKEIHDELRRRAAVLAIAPEQERESGSSKDIVEFTLASENYGIDSAFVIEVYKLKDLTLLPGAPDYITGIVSIRGNIIAVVDLKKFFDLPAKGLGELDKVIILSDSNMEFGILTDSVLGIKAIFQDEILPVPPSINGIGREYIEGITRDRLIILNAAKLLSDKKIIVDININ